MAHSLDHILQRADTWRGQPRHRAIAGIATGHPALDRQLHAGGWPQDGLSELLTPCPGIGELELLLPVLNRLQAQQRWLLWLNPPFIPYAPALAAAGLDLERLLVGRIEDNDTLLWTAEQALRGGCGALLCWLERQPVNYAQLRKLQLAAAEARTPGFFFRSLTAAQQHSPATLRLSFEPTADGLALHILKQRGGAAGQRLELSRKVPLAPTPPLTERPAPRRRSARLLRLHPIPPVPHRTPEAPRP